MFNFSQVRWKMTVKNFVLVKENQLTSDTQISQNYTSYNQLTFLNLFSYKSNFNNYKIVKNTSNMKHKYKCNWTASTSCTQNEAERARETLILLESVTENVTGNAQPGARLDILFSVWLLAISQTIHIPFLHTYIHFLLCFESKVQ